MVAPLDFSKDLPAMAGGRSGLLAVAREIALDHPVTRAGSIDNMDPGSLARHARHLLVAAFRELIQGSVREAVSAHLAAVRDEHEMMEGPAPSDGDIEWHEALRDSQKHSLRGYVERVIGREIIDGAVNGLKPSEPVADALVAKAVEDDVPASVDRFLRAMSVTDEDVAALVEHVRATHTGAKESASEANGPALINARVRVGRVLLTRAVGDMVPPPAIETMERLLAAPDRESFDMEADALNLSDAEVQEMLGAADQIAPEDAPDVVQRAVIDVHRSLAPVVTHRQAAAAPLRGRPRVKPHPEPSALTDAVRQAVDVILSRTSTTEQSLADALGVTRTELRSCRTGKTNLEPTPAQFNSLSALTGGLADEMRALATRLRDEYESRRGIAS